MIACDASVLRLYLNANERWHGAPLYRAIVEKACADGLAGASVFGVELSFGAHRRLHDTGSEYTSYDLPVVIEIIDASERVAALATALAAMTGQGLAVTSAARVVRDARAEPDTAAKDATTMTLESAAKRVTVYIGSSDTCDGRNLAVAIVERCRAMGLAGATASRGVMGFGKRSVIHRSRLLGLSEDLPEKVEIVDRADAIARILPTLEAMIGGGLIVVEDVHVVRYTHAPESLGEGPA